MNPEKKIPGEKKGNSRPRTMIAEVTVCIHHQHIFLASLTRSYCEKQDRSAITGRPSAYVKLTSRSSSGQVYHSHTTTAGYHGKQQQQQQVLGYGHRIVDDLASALQECATTRSLEEGRQIHARAFQLGFSQDLYLSSQILNLYRSCGCMVDARSIFDATQTPNLFFWNTMIRGYTDWGHYEPALNLFLHMVNLGLRANNFTFPFVLKSCAALQLFDLGRQIHGVLVTTGFYSDVFVSSSLMHVYCKWGRVWDARQMFDRMPERSLVTWNSMISGYAQNGLSRMSLEMIDVMPGEGCPPSVSTWNSLVAGCVRSGDGELALENLRLMQSISVIPNVATFNTLLPVFSTCASLVQLKEIHGFATKQGMMEFDDKLLSAIAVSYASYNGCATYAHELFDQIRLKASEVWNLMISGFIHSGQFHEACHVFRKMMLMHKQGGEERSTKVSLTMLLSECSRFSTTHQRPGEEIHAHAHRIGLETDTSVNNALVAMYARRGDVELAQRAFLSTPERDVVSWNTMIWSYAHNQDYDRAFKLFYQMHNGDVRPDQFTFGSILRGCGHFSSLRQGMVIHGYIIRSGFSENHYVVQNSLIDMYSKCGCVEQAESLFNKMPIRDTVSWNTMISCYGINAHPLKAFWLFDRMQGEGWKPNRVTFLALLSACSHAGLVEEGLEYFDTMAGEHGIAPDEGHYACIVDNLGRAGQLDKAYHLIRSMPMEPDDCVWGALLGGCRIHGNVILAEVAAKHLAELEPQHSGYHVLLSNIYAAACRWNDVAQVRATMKDKGVNKYPGCSWIEISDEHHVFLTADKSHDQCGEIYSTLDGLTKQLNLAGYIPSVIYSKLDVESGGNG